jgi:hypothetical protein
MSALLQETSFYQNDGEKSTFFKGIRKLIGILIRLTNRGGNISLA